jgi:hypothetical protein
MNRELQDLIRKARRDLKQVSGIPMTEEERAEDARNAEIEAMDKFLLRTLGVKTTFQLLYTSVWSNGSAAAELKVDECTFRLRKDDDIWVINIVTDNNERELTTGSGQYCAHRTLAIFAGHRRERRPEPPFGTTSL